jgi:hypothetical protein
MNQSCHCPFIICTSHNVACFWYMVNFEFLHSNIFILVQDDIGVEICAANMMKYAVSKFNDSCLQWHFVAIHGIWTGYISVEVKTHSWWYQKCCAIQCSHWAKHLPCQDLYLVKTMMFLRHELSKTFNTLNIIHNWLPSQPVTETDGRIDIWTEYAG